MEKSCPILINVGPKARIFSRIQIAVFRCLMLFLQGEISKPLMVSADGHVEKAAEGIRSASLALRLMMHSKDS